MKLKWPHDKLQRSNLISKDCRAPSNELCDHIVDSVQQNGMDLDGALHPSLLTLVWLITKCNSRKYKIQFNTVFWTKKWQTNKHR